MAYLTPGEKVGLTRQPFRPVKVTINEQQQVRRSGEDHATAPIEDNASRHAGLGNRLIAVFGE